VAPLVSVSGTNPMVVDRARIRLAPRVFRNQRTVIAARVLRPAAPGHRSATTTRLVSELRRRPSN
jgi:hypothetical protein